MKLIKKEHSLLQEIFERNLATAKIPPADQSHIIAGAFVAIRKMAVPPPVSDFMDLQTIVSIGKADLFSARTAAKMFQEKPEMLSALLFGANPLSIPAFYIDWTKATHDTVPKEKIYNPVKLIEKAIEAATANKQVPATREEILFEIKYLAACQNFPSIEERRKSWQNTLPTDEEIAASALVYKAVTGKFPKFTGGYDFLPPNSLGWGSVLTSLTKRDLTTSKLVARYYPELMVPLETNISMRTIFAGAAEKLKQGIDLTGRASDQEQHKIAGLSVQEISRLLILGKVEDLEEFVPEGVTVKSFTKLMLATGLLVENTGPGNKLIPAPPAAIDRLLKNHDIALNP